MSVLVHDSYDRQRHVPLGITKHWISESESSFRNSYSGRFSCVCVEAFLL